MSESLQQIVDRATDESPADVDAIIDAIIDAAMVDWGYSGIIEALVRRIKRDRDEAAQALPPEKLALYDELARQLSEVGEAHPCETIG